MQYKSKKGQFYILTAVLICAALVGVFSTAIQTKHNAQSQELNELCNHYKSESKELINSVIKDQGDVLSAYNNFANNYYEYGKSITYNFGFIYVITYQNTTFVRNYLDFPVNISFGSDNMMLKNYPTAPYDTFGKNPDSVSFIYANNLYNYSTEYNVGFEMICIYKTNNRDLTIVN